MKWTALTMLILISAILNGCATASGDYCQIGGIFYPSSSDILTTESKQWVVANNEKYTKLCGVR